MHDVSVTPFYTFVVLILPFWLYICILDHNVSKPGLEPRARASEIWSQARAHCKPLLGPSRAQAWTGSAQQAQGLRPSPAHHYCEHPTSLVWQQGLSHQCLSHLCKYTTTLSWLWKLLSKKILITNKVIFSECGTVVSWNASCTHMGEHIQPDMMLSRLFLSHPSLNKCVSILHLFGLYLLNFAVDYI